MASHPKDYKCPSTTPYWGLLPASFSIPPSLILIIFYLWLDDPWYILFDILVIVSQIEYFEKRRKDGWIQFEHMKYSALQLQQLLKIKFLSWGKIKTAQEKTSLII